MSAVDGLAIVVDDAYARYPLVVDPVVVSPLVTLGATAVDNDLLGFSVALVSGGGRVFAGAGADDGPGGFNVGSLRHFVNGSGTWFEDPALHRSDNATNDFLGSSVAAGSASDCNVAPADCQAVVGAWADDTASGVDSGSATIFYWQPGTGWLEGATLLPSTAAANDQAGIAVAMTGDASRAFVGSWVADVPGASNSGSVTVFVRSGTTWSEEVTLRATVPRAGARLGASLAVSSDGSRLIAGADAEWTGATPSVGRAYVFVRSGTTWTQEAILMAPDGSAQDLFGGAVAMSSDGARVLVGASLDDTAAGVNAGSVYTFVRTGSTWAYEANLVHPMGGAEDRFGKAVALSSDGVRALVGAPLDDSPLVDAGSAHLFFRSGSTWGHEAIITATDAGGLDQLGFSVALEPGGRYAAIGVPYDDTTLGPDSGSVRVYTVTLAPTGTSCSVDSACTSGFCRDGVCCSTDCGGGPNDCRACAGALTGFSSGTCGSLSSTVAPTVVCRAGTDLCDPAETCRTGTTTCPVDVPVAVAGTPCRPTTGPCDVPELCSGSSAACAADARLAAGTMCRPSAGDCDPAEVCDGAAAACPADALAAAGEVCRDRAGPCDVEERCTGSLATCPSVDALAPALTPCRGARGACDLIENCTGLDAACPPDALVDAGEICAPTGGGLCDADDVCSGASPICQARFVPAGLECRASRGECDPAEACTGASATCPSDELAPPTQACGPPPSGDCDAPDRCTGTSADCMETFLSGVECREAAGTCDQPETCSGGAPTCPPDVVLAAGVVCRDSSAACDATESCDGTSTVCPVDVTSCPRSDAGRDAATEDGGGETPVAVTGCACRVGVRSSWSAPGVLALIAVGLVRYRRRRTPLVASQPGQEEDLGPPPAQRHISDSRRPRAV